MGGIDDGRVDADAGTRRRAGGDMFAARDLGGGHGHDGAGDVGIAPARCVTARRIDGDRLLPGNHPRHDFIFDIGDGRFLLLGKAFHIVMSKADVGLELFRDEGAGGVDFLGGEHHVAVVFVEFRRIVEGGLIAARFDVGEDLADRVMHVRGIGARGEMSFFQIVTGHGGSCRKGVSGSGRGAAGESLEG